MRKIFLLMLSALLVMAVPALAQDDMDGESAYVRVAYMVADAPEIDIYVNGEGLADMVPEELMTEGLGIPLVTMAPGAITDFIAAPPGAYEVTVTAAGDTEPVQGPIPAELAAGQYITVVAFGSVEAETVEVGLLTEDLAAYEQGGAVVSVFNAVEGSPPLNIVTADGTPLFSNLTYAGRSMDDGMMETEEAMATEEMEATEEMGDMEGDMSSPFADANVSTVFVPADFTGMSYDVSVQSAEDDSELAAFPEVEILPDTAYFIVAFGTAPDTVIVTADLTVIAPLMDDMGEAEMDMEATEEMGDMEATEEMMETEESN